MNDDYEKDKKFDPFIYKTFQLCLDNKTEIKVDMRGLSKCYGDESFLDILFGGRGFKLSKITEGAVEDEPESDPEEGGHHTYDVIDPSYIIPEDETNILRFDLFKNLEKLIIDYTQDWTRYCAFSLTALLNKLKGTKIKEIKITGNRFNSSAWFSWDWSHKEGSWKQAYIDKGYLIECVRHWDISTHSISIIKQNESNCFKYEKELIQLISAGMNDRIPREEMKSLLLEKNGNVEAVIQEVWERDSFW